MVTTNRVRARRYLTSWYVFVVLLGGLVFAILFGLTVLRNQVEQRAHKGSFETAGVIAALTVGRHVIESDFHSVAGLTDVEVSNLDGDVATLQGEHRLVGLEVWRNDGQSLYADPGHPAHESILPSDEQARIVENEPWIVVDATDRGVPTWEVFLPYDAGTDGVPDGLIEVLIPDANVGRGVRTTGRQLYALAVAVFVIGALGLAILRRRLVRREFEACHDRLTGLMNWGGFRDAVRASIYAERMNPVGCGVLLLIDLDGSSRSTTRSVTQPVTCCSSKSGTRSDRPCAHTTSWLEWAGTNSRCC